MPTALRVTRSPAWQNHSLAARTPTWSRSDAVRDCLFLGLIVGVSFVLYAPHLGFYSDDWVFLQLLNHSEGKSLRDLAGALYAGDRVIQQRPVQVVYLAGLYRLFGLQPLGYHLVNGAVLVANAVLFYLVLRRLRLPRLIALSVPLIYALLPNYSTDRFWVAAFQAPLSITLYLLSLYSLLRSVDGTRWRAAWLACSGICAIGSAMAYEVTLPLLLLNPLLAWFAPRWASRDDSGTRGRASGLSFLISALVPVLAVTAFKALVTVRLNVQASYLSHALDVLAGALRLNYGVYGVGLPYVIGWIIRNAADWHNVLGAAILGAATAAYLYRAAISRSGEEPLLRQFWLLLFGAGVVVFVLGYVVFLVSADITFESTSLANRVGIAAAIGVALSFVAVVGLASRLLASETLRRLAFCSLIALVCAGGFLINNTLASFWQDAFVRQQSVLKAMSRDVGPPRDGSVLLLDGVCLEHGGAYSFTGERDLTALLAILYPKQSFEARALSHRPEVLPDGLLVFTHRESVTFTYGERLVIYNHGEGVTYPLTNAETAKSYFSHSQFDPDKDCPPLFAWGWNTR